MNKVILTDKELENIKPGEAITLAAIIAIMIVSIIAVAAYKLFTSNDGIVKLPGGYQFSWN